MCRACCDPTKAQKGGSGEELQALQASWISPPYLEPPQEGSEVSGPLVLHCSQDDARAVESSTGRPRPDTAAASFLGTCDAEKSSPKLLQHLVSDVVSGSGPCLGGDLQDFRLGSLKSW